VGSLTRNHRAFVHQVLPWLPNVPASRPTPPTAPSAARAVARTTTIFGVSKIANLPRLLFFRNAITVAPSRLGHKVVIAIVTNVERGTR
jgi:hypothetical protein